MIRLHQAISAVIAGTLVAGLAGGLVGAGVGRLAPSFVAWIHSPIFGVQAAGLRPRRVRAGPGYRQRPLPGAGASLLLTLALVIRDAYLARVAPQEPPQAARAPQLAADRVHQAAPA